MNRIYFQQRLSQNLRKLQLTLALAIGFGFSGIAQCPTGNVQFTSQAQVNQFAIDYPNCTEINGSLTIAGNDIVDLNGLSNIVEVTGYLGVYNNTLLQNFNGLENLNTIGLSLDVSNNTGLLNANGLSGLTDIGTEIQFFNNALLQDMSSLNNVTAIGGGLWILQNPQLNSLSGLQNMLQIGGDIDIEDNTVLSDISALENINPASITPIDNYGLTITGNPALSVCELPNFCTYLSNPSNTHPRVISGNAANCISEQAVIDACAAPADCPSGDLFLQTQAQVDAFIINYPNCTVYDGDITITGSDITNLNGLNNIVSILGHLDITFVHNITDFAGLSNLANIGGYLMVQSCNGLTSFNGLQSLTNVSANINIAVNNALTDISALQNINPDSFTSLAIFDNTNLAVCHLPNFCTYLSDSSNSRLIEDNATDCISNEAVLNACNAPAEGCTNITSTYIQWPQTTVTPACTNSPEVITAEGETGEYSKIQVTAQVGYYFSSSVATDYLTITNEDGTVVYTYGTGEVSITSAADQVVRFYLHLDDDCNGSSVYRSRIVQCQGTVSVSELNKANITYFPNPVNDILNVTSQEIISTIDVINMLGQTVVTKTANSTTSQIEMAQLPSGNYLVKVTSSTGVQTVRVTKQ